MNTNITTRLTTGDRQQCRPPHASTSAAFGLTGCALLFYAGLANAASSENAYLDEMPVVLSVSRLSQPVDEAPAAVTVIDRETIRDAGIRELSEVFRLVPGMVVGYHASRFYASDSTVAYHGLTDTYARSMQVLIDGRSVYSPLFGGVIWNDIPVVIDDIDRIEVIRGPNSASYGANSFMGVINIVTRHSAEEQGRFVSLAAGRNFSEGVARYGGRSGDLTYRLTASLTNNQGEDPYIDNPDLRINIPSDLVWTYNKFDDKKIRQLNFRADQRINSTDELELQLGYNGGDRQSGEVGSDTAAAKVADNQFELARWKRVLRDDGELSVQFYHSQESTRTTILDTGGHLNNADVIARRYDLEVQHSFSPSAQTRLVWGGSVRLDKVYAPYYHYPDTNIYPAAMFDKNKPQYFQLSRLFGNLEWRARPDLIFNFGAMAEDNNFTGTDITPRIAANWHFLPGQTLRLSNSRATRTPTDFEKVRADPFLVLGALTKKLVPERVNSTDIGYLGNFNGLNIDFRVFRDEFSDLIVENGASLAGNNLNPGNAVIKGFETRLQWQIGADTRLIYALSHSKVSSPDQAGQAYTNSVPTNIQSLMLTHRLNRHWSASLIGYQTGETHFLDTDSDPGMGRGYFIKTAHRWDGRLAYRFRADAGRGEFALVVQNLADDRYLEFRHDNQPAGRTAWLNLKLDL
ncbi:MAG: TonB-dependent receptor [Sulfuricella sp.]|nr:TonB-dependent receptor [Sulfuricella sp.]